jgi:hypothetical protein
MAQSRFGGQVISVQSPAGASNGMLMPPPADGQQQDMSVVAGITPPANAEVLAPPSFMADEAAPAAGPSAAPAAPQVPAFAMNGAQPRASRFGGTVVNEIRMPVINPEVMAQLPDSIKPEVAPDGSLGRYAGMMGHALGAGILSIEDLARMGIGGVGKGMIGLTYLSTVPARVLGFDTSGADKFLADWDKANDQQWMTSKAEQFKEDVDTLTEGYYAPKTPAERIFYAGVEFVGGGVGPTAVLGKAGKAANALEQAGRASEITATQRAGQFLSYQSLRDVAAATGAGAAMQGAEEAGYGPASQILAPFVGGIAGYGAGAALQSAGKAISNPSQLLMRAARLSPEQMAREINTDVVNAAEATGVRLTPDAATNAAAAQTIMQKLNSMAITQDHFRGMMEEVDGSFLKSYEKQLDSLSTDTFASADEAVQTLKPALQTAENAAEARASALYEAADMALPQDATHLPTNTIEYLKKSLSKLDESLLPSRDEAAVRGAFAKLAEGLGTNKVTAGIQNAIKELDNSIANSNRQLARTQDTAMAEELEKGIRNSQTLKDTLTTLQPILNDPQFIAGGIRTITDASGIPVMQIDPILARQNAPKVKQLTATIRSLNQTIAWDDEVRGVKQLLEGAKGALKRDLEEYGQSNSAWYGQWTKANEVFGKDVAQRFREGVVRSMITGEKPTAILNSLNSTSAVKALDAALGDTDNGKKVAAAIKRFKLEEILGRRLQNATTEDVQYGQYAAAMNPAKKEEVALIRSLAGEQYTQLENLATVAQALAQSFARYGNPSRTGNRIMDLAFPQDGWAQAGQAILAYATGGIWGVAGYGVMQATPRMMARQLTDKAYIELMKKAVTAQVKQDASATTKAMRELTYWYRDTMKELGEGPIMRFSDDFKQEFMKARGERGGSGTRLYSGIPLQGLAEITEDVVRAGYKALKPSDVMIDDMANTDLGGGFANTIGNALNGLKTRKATGRQWKVELEKAGARPEELEFTHVGPFLEQNADKVMSRAAVKQMVEFSKPEVQIVGLAKRRTMANPEYLKEKTAILERRKKLDADFGEKYAEILGVGNQYKAMMEQLGGFEKIRSDWAAGFNRNSDVDALGALLDAATQASGGKQDVKEILYSVARRAMKAEGTIGWDGSLALQKVASDMSVSSESEIAKENAKRAMALTKSLAEEDMMVSGSKMPENVMVDAKGLSIQGSTKYDQYTAQKDENLFENKFELLVKFPDQSAADNPQLRSDFVKKMREKYGPAFERGERNMMTPDERLYAEFMVASMRARSEQGYSFTAPHFDGYDHNLLAHARVNVTPDAEGNRVLVIDEVQSDLHNKGREEGYVKKDPNAMEERARISANAEERIDELEPQLRDAEDAMNAADEALSGAEAEFDDWVQADYLAEANKVLAKYSSEPPAPFIGQAKVRLEQIVEANPDAAADAEALRKMYIDKKREMKLYELESASQRAREAFDEIDSELSDARRIMDGDDDWLPDAADTKGAPDTAPLRNTWSEMLVRRAIKFAVDNGIDKVGITSGREQAARWNLGQWVRNVIVMPKAKIDLEAADGFLNDPDKILVQVNNKNGERMNLSSLNDRVRADKFGAFFAMNREDLATVFGKARADKMIAEADAMWPKVEEAFNERRDMPFSNISKKGEEMKIYNFSQLKEYIKDQKAMFDEAYAGENEKIISGGHDYHLNQIEQQFFTTLQPKAASIIDDSNFMVGGEGRVKAYDEILMRAVNKLLRKYGGDDAQREAVPTRLPESVYKGMMDSSVPYSGMFTGDKASPQVVDALKKLGIDVNLEDLAQNKAGGIVKAAGVDPENTAETWTFRIPEKLKEEYRNSGVPFFAIPAMVGVGAAMGNGQE